MAETFILRRNLIKSFIISPDHPLFIVSAIIRKMKLAVHVARIGRKMCIQGLMGKPEERRSL
jgi:hypothetical protein